MRIKMICFAAQFFCVVFLFSFNISVNAQQKFMIEKGKINFISNAPLEIIKASSDKIKGVIDPVSNQFVFSVSISSFNGFNNSLQRVHFNEKYMESERYPVAQFSGKIIEQIDFSKDGTYEVRAKGDLNIHGQKQVRIIKAKVIVKNGMVSIESNFNVPLADHKITIPSIINEKIATEIEVNIAATLSPQVSSNALVNSR